MAVNDVYHVAANGVASGSSTTFDGSGAGTGAAEVAEFAGTADAAIYRETDVDGDGTFEISIQIASPTGEWHSQQNGLIVSASNAHRIRVENTSAAGASYYATGMEVSD